MKTNSPLSTTGSYDSRKKRTNGSRSTSQPVITGFLIPGGCLFGKNNAERKRILIAYLDAVKASFPDAWGDEDGDSYSLLQTAGLQIMLGLLPDAMQRCD